MAVIVMLSPRAAGFLLHFVLEMSCFYTREHCVTHKINALDDFVKSVRPAVWGISLCFCSPWHSAAHVVPCSHMGFKHRTRAGAAIVQSTGEETNTNNMPYPALKCPLSPWTSAVPSLCAQVHTHSCQTLSQSLKWCRSAASIASTVQYLLLSPAGVWDHAVINGQAARGGEGKGSSKTVLFNC